MEEVTELLQKKAKKERPRSQENPLRILLLNYEYPPLGGGAGNATRELLRSYQKHFPSLYVDVVTSSVTNTFEKEKVGSTITLYRLPIGEKKREDFQKQSYSNLLRYSWEALSFCRSRLLSSHKFSYDLLHAFFAVPPGILATILFYEFRLPYIISLRGADVPGYAQKFRYLYPFLTPLLAFSWKRAAAVVANSKGLKELATSHIPHTDIQVIPNGVALSEFSCHLCSREAKEDMTRREKMPRKNRPLTILCASRLTKRKGFERALQAVSLLYPLYPHIKLLLAGGDGDAASDLRLQVKKLGISSIVHFTGPYTRNGLRKLQDQSDVFLLPSYNEGMSNSLLEAMAGGLPVLMTPTGGAEELIEEGENGFLLREENVVKDIVQRLEYFLRHPREIVRMGRKSRQKARLYAWDRVAERYVHLYDTVASQKKAV